MSTQSDENAKSGFYEIGIDTNWRDFNKDIASDGKLHEVYVVQNVIN